MDRMLYVANLDSAVTDHQLKRLFADYGVVVSAHVAVVHPDGRSRGFGFVEMQTNYAARAAWEALDGCEVEGRPLVVTSARPRRPFGGSADAQTC